MAQTLVREIGSNDLSAILSLNQAVVEVTSSLDKDSLAAILELSQVKLAATSDNRVIGFLIAITEASDYRNDNFAWFSSRLRDFLYIDRIVVAEPHRGSGVGQLLYSRASRMAAELQLLNICAEIDSQPPNRASLRFHERSGFVEIGKRMTSRKELSMQMLTLDNKR